MPQSMFDSSVEFNANNGALTVVFNGHHALIIIEILHPDSMKLEIHVTHYLPKERSRKGESCAQYLANQKQYFETPREAEVLHEVIHGINNLEELMKREHISQYDTQTHSRTRSQLLKLINHAKQQKNNQIPVPLFHIRGIAYKDGTCKNCCSWVREELQFIGINIGKSFWDRHSSDALCEVKTAQSDKYTCVLL